MFPAFASRVNMINTLRPSPAVLAKIVVAREYGLAVQCSTSPIGSTDLVAKTSYRRGEDFKFFRAQDTLTCVKNFCLIGQHQKKGSSHGNN
tara:strand:+ start:2171 stop:2443 length:273 start_codon:yes stop_codon:yes gene_type:complete